MKEQRQFWCRVRHAIASRAMSTFLKLRSLRSDEQGTISVLSVIVLLLLTMLLGMILNVGQQIDDKIELQNAADASTYSSGVVIARGMNTIAFTNHLLSETFALTAYFREGRDRKAESVVPAILLVWHKVSEQLSGAEYDHFRDMHPAIIPKIQLEQQMVTAFGEMTAAKASILLPALEAILGMPEDPSGMLAPSEDAAARIANSHLIPVFQRAVVLAVPAAATEVAREVTRRNTPGRMTGTAQAVIWNTSTVPIAMVDQKNPRVRTLPGVDPSTEGPDFPYYVGSEGGVLLSQARERRDQLARHYLREWIDDDGFDMDPFEREEYHAGGRVSAKMSQFVNLFRGFTCANLERLLDVEFPFTNMPHMLRQSPCWSCGENQQYLEDQFTFDTVVYRPQATPTMPGMYRKPITGDNMGFARVLVYLPKPRYITWGACPRFHCPQTDWFGVTKCVTPCIDRWPTDWSLFSQNWTAKLIPTGPQDTYELMQANPQQVAPGVTLPKMNSIQVRDVKAVNFH